MDSRILLAVSGGMDSMVMLHRMLQDLGPSRLAVAHCNFCLRGDESDADAGFVKAKCEEAGLPFHLREFETSAYAEKHGLGTQEAARDLRYAWFFELMETQGYSELATAHHRDDSIESFFINLLRGSGPQGLSGISEDEERKLIRPLLEMGRVDIQRYAEEQRVQWREDSSNNSITYLRNKIRHDLIPELKQMRPGFEKVMQRNMSIQEEVADFISSQAKAYRKVCFLENEGSIRIQPDGREGEQLLLKTNLREYGFSETQLDDILQSNQSGRQVMTQSHVLTSHRGSYLLSEVKVPAEGPWSIEKHLSTVHLPVRLESSLLSEVPTEFDPNPCIAYLDAYKLDFPLTIRYWKEGDRFRPLGMKGVKKLSDFLIDEKVPLNEKDDVLVVESSGEIVWVLGHRVSEDFKVHKETAKILLIVADF